MKVLLDGLFFNSSGFAEDNRMLFETLLTLGLDIQIIARDYSETMHSQLDEKRKSLVLPPTHNFQSLPVDLYICNIMAGSIKFFPFGKKNIARTMFETDRLPSHWVNELNKFDQVWVASKFNQSTFTNSGVIKPIFIVPSFLDLSKYDINGYVYPLSLNTQFNFLSVFDWQPRKGYDILINAFLEEFHDDLDVGLIIKTYTLSTNLDPLNEINNIMARYEPKHRNCEIYVINGTLNEYELIGLYRYSNAFVLPTRGEGWGRPLFEAMSLGLPTIATNWGGQTEFMNADNSFLIDLDCIETIDSTHYPIFQGHMWAKPSTEDLRKKMRYIVQNTQEAVTVGMKAMNEIKSNYSLEKNVVLLRDIFNQIP
ncbi:glycosyltransferase family 4 protein [Alicyclobacillus tolerans]|uniref:glycosyltransferase family 4 protein n=1 Tax=Alicyclobacillus tolerans TaxID=90970 RepID=UPI003B7DA1ED